MGNPSVDRGVASARCFNGPNNWKLGWYSDSQHNVTDSGEDNGVIAGIADYDPEDSSSHPPVIITVAGVGENEGWDWYVSYNRKIGINAGTVEGGDQVLVHLGLQGATTTLLHSKLSAGETYTFNDFSVTYHEDVTDSAGVVSASVSIENTEGNNGAATGGGIAGGVIGFLIIAGGSYYYSVHKKEG